MEEINEPQLQDCLEAPSDVTAYLGLVNECADDSKPVDFRQTRQRLVYTIESSRLVKRSPFRTTIMLLGETGTGKSSTINHLLNSNVMPVSDSKSETRSVTEYTSTSTSTDRILEDGRQILFSVSNLRFSLIDTPGLNDTAGENQDACNLWAIKKFLQSNTENIMRGDAGMWVYPNIVLLCFDAMDKRFEGENSCFVKNLKLLQTMAVIDSENPNVVIAMTFVYSIPPKDWEARVGKKVEKVKSVFKSAMGFEAPVVYLENDFEGHYLSTDDDKTGTVLRNGEVQPTNLYRAMMDVFKRNNDQLAYLTVRQFFRQGVSGQNFEKDREVPCKIAATEELDDDEKECRDALSNISEAAQRLKSKFEKEMRKQAEQLQIAEEQLLEAHLHPAPRLERPLQPIATYPNPQLQPYNQPPNSFPGGSQCQTIPFQANITPCYTQNIHTKPPQSAAVLVSVTNNSAPINVDVIGRASFVDSQTPLLEKPEEGWFTPKMAIGALAFVVVGVAIGAGAVLLAPAAPAIIAGAGKMATAASAYIASGFTSIINIGGTVVSTVGVAEMAEVAGIVAATLTNVACAFR